MKVEVLGAPPLAIVHVVSGNAAKAAKKNTVRSHEAYS